MTVKGKKNFSIVLFAIMLLALIVYSSIVVAEFYVSRYGKIVNAEVADVSEVCRGKKKYVTLKVDSTLERIKLYGVACRGDDFIVGSTIQVRRSRRLDIITVPNNLAVTRLIVFPLFTLLALIGLISFIKSDKMTE